MSTSGRALRFGLILLFAWSAIACMVAGSLLVSLSGFRQASGDWFFMVFFFWPPTVFLTSILGGVAVLLLGQPAVTARFVIGCIVFGVSSYALLLWVTGAEVLGLLLLLILNLAALALTWFLITTYGGRILK